MDITSWSVHHGSYLVELTPCKVPHVITLWNLPCGTYTMEVT